MAEEKDQEAMAAEWAAALEEQDEREEAAKKPGEASAPDEEHERKAQAKKAKEIPEEPEHDTELLDAMGGELSTDLSDLGGGDSEAEDLDGTGDADKSDDELAAEWAAALAEDEEKSMAKEKAKQEYASRQAKEASFVDLTDEAKAPSSDGNRKDLDFILDIPLDVSAELGRARLLINELLQLGQGSVVELNKLAGEPLEVYVNGKIIARGEAVVINEKFGIRLTDIISPIERVKQLG